MIKKLSIMLFLLCISAKGMERTKPDRHCEPIVYVTEITNTTSAEYFVYYNRKPISLIKPNQTIALNKRLLNFFKDSGDIGIHELKSMTIKNKENELPHLVLKCSIMMNQTNKSFTTETFLSFLEGVMENGHIIPPLTILETEKDTAKYHNFNDEHDDYYINIHIMLAGSNLEQSTLEVAHIVQAKDLFKNVS